MKFGKTLETAIEESHPAWKRYAVDYKGLKKSLPKEPIPAQQVQSPDSYVNFWEIFEQSQQGLDKFYKHKESWAKIKHATLTQDLERSLKNLASVNIHEMKEHLVEFRTEVELVREFLQVNQTAFSKILKKFDKRTFSRIRDNKLAFVMETCNYLDGAAMDSYLKKIDDMIRQLDDLYLPSPGQKRRLQQSSSASSPSILQEKTDRMLATLQRESPFFDNNPACAVLPSFALNEIDFDTDEILGQGKYCIVRPIKDIYLKHDETDEGKLLFKQQVKERPYAIKQIHVSLRTSQKVEGAIDLAIEAKFLSCLAHENIISLQGTPDGLPYFLLVDRLFGSLEDQIYKTWQPSSNKTKMPTIFKNKQAKQKQKDLWNIRVKALADVANGLEYLHSKSIIHRDIKPANIGFAKNGTCKIFDFGLVKELQPKDFTGNPEEYRATGRTGTRKYMAPEVVLYKPYGKPVDVYSFAMTMWETLTLKRPFENMTLQKLNAEVLSKSKRPTIPWKWPNALSSIIEKAWTGYPNERPNVSEIRVVLESLLKKDASDGVSA